MWQLVFWVSIALVLYTYAGYPFILYIVNKRRSRRSFASGRDGEPSVCLIISAFNEEKVIRQKILNSLAQKYPANKLTILVASDGSSDDTVNIAGEYAGFGVKLYHYPSRRGKSAVIDDVIKELSEELVVFTDANSLFAPDAIRNLTKRFADPTIGCVIGKLCYVDPEDSSVGKGESAYWRYEGMISRLESSLQSVLVANGSIFAIRRDLYQQLYPEVANDFQMPIDIASAGWGVVYEPSARALEHSTVYWREEFGRKVRIILRGMTGFAMLRHRIHGFRLWQFWSHKLLRWMVGLFLLAAFVSSAVLAVSSSIYAALLVCQVVFYLMTLVGWGLKNAQKPRRLFNIPFYFAVVNCAAVTGIIKFLSGRRQTVWEKAESSRLVPLDLPGIETGSFEKATPLQMTSAQDRQTEDTRSRAKVAKS